MNMSYLARTAALCGKVTLRLMRERSRAPPQFAIHGQPGMPFLMTEELILARMDPRHAPEHPPSTARRGNLRTFCYDKQRRATLFRGRAIIYCRVPKSDMYIKESIL